MKIQGLGLSLHVDAADFAAQLEHAIERSRKVSAMIEANTTPTTTFLAPAKLRAAFEWWWKPMMIPDRRYRKW